MVVWFQPCGIFRLIPSQNKEKNNHLTTITKALNPFGQKPGLVVSELNQ